MVLIGLLAIAVVTLVLGFIFSTTWLFVVSLVASVLAALLLVRFALQQRSAERRSVEAGSDEPRSDDKPAADQSDSDGDAAVLKKSREDKPSRAEKKAEKAKAKDAAERSAGTSSTAAADTEVLVVDGAPDYHLSGCSTLGAEQTVGIPLSQALEDGFSACATCSPPTEIGDAGKDSESSPAAASAATESSSASQPLTEVWVVDGSPEFHVEGCSELKDGAAEQIPADQAVEDGFVACSVCKPVVGEATSSAARTADQASNDEPDKPTEETAKEEKPEQDTPRDDDRPEAQTDAGAPASTAPAGAAAGDREVWVADGYPEYHVQNCSELEGLEAETVPYDQAVEDGFQPCVVCNPDHARPEDAPADDTASSASTASSVAPSVADGEVLVVDGLPDFHTAGCVQLEGQDAVAIPREQALEDGFTACTVCQPEAAAGDQSQAPADGAEAEAERSEPSEPSESGDSGDAEASDTEVWVVDGFPAYHRTGCRLLLNEHGVAIPHDQAVEDGFEACDVCEPEAATAPEQAFVPPSAGSPDVWVVDGRPQFHRPECREILGLDSEPIPHDQAVEDGFEACEVCQPEADAMPDGASTPETPAQPAAHEPEPVAAGAADAPPAAAVSGFALAEVWVVDGHPDYHRAQCSVISGQDSVAIPHDQAVEDGFSECTVCTPESATAPSATAPPAADRPEPAVSTVPDAESRAEPAAEPEPAVESEPEPAVESEPEPAPEPVTASAPAEPASSSSRSTGREVWVIEGRPRFHTHDCLIIKGQPATKMTIDEATGDGFKACSLCKAAA